MGGNIIKELFKRWLFKTICRSLNNFTSIHCFEIISTINIISAHRKCFLLQIQETCPPTNAQRVKGCPLYLIAGDRSPSTQSLSASVIRIPGVRNASEEKNRDNSIRADKG
ncbi:hypothetical protein CEXT_544301 [Caerostris extrusa]|uniref:Uncharacterized protein n=1 Tax=Caerostris extrusa TaxID=172846 RepID=A0AAV4QAX5_CAEEX|nr:hypothetical protein CEXT_544301 [Caerostris extrusa]